MNECYDFYDDMDRAEQERDIIDYEINMSYNQGRINTLLEIKNKMISFHARTVSRYGVDIIETRADAFDELEEWITNQMKGSDKTNE